eukprot:1461076-Rhodomonas_salina.1
MVEDSLLNSLRCPVRPNRSCSMIDLVFVARSTYQGAYEPIANCPTNCPRPIWGTAHAQTVRRRVRLCSKMVEDSLLNSLRYPARPDR